MEYTKIFFPEFMPEGALGFLSDGVKETASRVSAIFDRFMEVRFTDAESISPQHLMAFMLYRVVGEPFSDDPRSGSSQLSTFLNSELGALVHSLRNQEL